MNLEVLLIQLKVLEFISAIDYPFSGLARIRNDRIQNIKRFPNNKKFKTGQLVKFRIKRNNVYNGKILLDKVRVLTDE